MVRAAFMGFDLIIVTINNKKKNLKGFRSRLQNLG